MPLHAQIDAIIDYRLTMHSDFAISELWELSRAVSALGHKEDESLFECVIEPEQKSVHGDWFKPPYDTVSCGSLVCKSKSDRLANLRRIDCGDSDLCLESDFVSWKIAIQKQCLYSSGVLVVHLADSLEQLLRLNVGPAKLLADVRESLIAQEVDS